VTTSPLPTIYIVIYNPQMIALATKNAAAMGDKAANASFCRGDAEVYTIPLFPLATKTSPLGT